MKKNDIVRIEITSLTSECSGVGKLNGMVIFVPFSAVGDILSVRILKVKTTYAYGKIEEIITPSPDRINVDCPVYGKCGGCSFRHISYEAELRAKESFVRDAFTRIGGLSPEFLPIVGAKKQCGYRNKLQIPIGTDRVGNITAGFYAFHSHRIVPCSHCLLQPDIFSDIVSEACKTAQELKIPAYDETTGRGVLRHIYLRKGHYSGELCLCTVASCFDGRLKLFDERLRKKFAQITASLVNINDKDTNVILGEREILLYGDGSITDTMCGNKISVSPKSFYQVNTPAAETLYAIAAEFAEAKGKLVLDLYCGAGTIGLSMAKSARKIIGAEIVPDAVENAEKNAAANGIENAEFICADAAKAAQILFNRNEKPNVIVIDPPRKGCGIDAAENIAHFGAERIVMVSCNPATAARDCMYFSQLGYTTEKCVAVDMFPRTGHVETVVLMSKTEK